LGGLCVFCLIKEVKSAISSSNCPCLINLYHICKYKDVSQMTEWQMWANEVDKSHFELK
jgi:hypothetical protein